MPEGTVLPDVEQPVPAIPQGRSNRPHHLIEAVEHAPHYKGHGRPVPQAADCKDDEYIQIFPGSAPPGAAQGDVEVVPEPVGQGHMPPPPEFCNGPGKIGCVKVLTQGEAHAVGHTQGHVCVGGEITVDLKGKGHRRSHHLHCAKTLRRVKDGVNQHRQPVGQHHLLKSAPQEAHQSLPEPVPVEGVGLPELRGELCRPSDGAGHHLGEEGEKQGVEQEIPLDFRLAPPHVHDITHSLKEVEGDAHRQHKVQHRGRPTDSRSLEHTSRQRERKVDIFKKEEQDNINQQAQHQHPPLWVSPQGNSRPIGGQDYKEQQGEIDRLGTQIEKPACQQQPQVPHLPGQQKIAQRCYRKKAEEGQG